MQKADQGSRRLQWATISLCLLFSILFGFTILVLFDAATARTASKEGPVTQKYFSPVSTIPSVEMGTDLKGEPTMVPTQRTIPASYEVEVEDGCRFSVPPEMFTDIRVGDRIRYREALGRFYRGCEWDSREDRTDRGYAAR